MDDERRRSAQQASRRKLTAWCGIIAAALFVIGAFAVNTGTLDDILRQRDSGGTREQVTVPVSRSESAGAPGERDIETRPEASTFESLPADNSLKQLHGAMLDAEAGRYDRAARRFQETLAFVERNQGGASPMAALVHFQVALMHQRRNDLKERERALQRTLGILEQYSDAELKRVPGMAIDGVDAAMIAADLGYIYWEWRRYEEAYGYYERAHKAAPELSTTESNRNRRLAISSAGLMASACMLGKWDVADRSMAELKERRVKVDSDLRKWLDYWVLTGEPRLASRKC